MDAPQSIWNRCLDYAAQSNVGLRRPNNQDAYAVSLAGSQADFEQRGHLFMVADGMGAHAAGELASKMAAEVVSLVYRKRLDQSPPEAILSAMLDANYQIHSRGLANPDFRGMGTTATTLVLLPTGAMVAHVGDSRAYRLRGTRIEQLTFDHSLVWEIRAAGQAPDLLPGYIPKNIITRSLGPNRTVQIDLEGPHPLQIGDTFLLCSDGLSGQVTDDEMGMVLGCLRCRSGPGFGGFGQPPGRARQYNCDRGPRCRSSDRRRAHARRTPQRRAIGQRVGPSDGLDGDGRDGCWPPWARWPWDTPGSHCWDC